MTTGRRGDGAVPGDGEAPRIRPPDTFESERLYLRRPRAEDAEQLFNAYGADPEVTRYLRWRPKSHPGEMADFLAYAAERWDERSEFHYVIELKDSRQPVGMIALVPGEHGIELGYVLARSRWGRGYVTEAARALTKWALAQPSVYRVWAFTDVENAASARVLERLGFEREGMARRWVVHPNISDVPRDAYLYSRVR